MNLAYLIYVFLFFIVNYDNEEFILDNQNFSKSDHLQLAEKVYLHSDRSIYNSGDDIWFKVYVTDPSTNKPSENTNNLHVELISPASEIICSRTVRIEDGTGKGDINLNDSIPSGKYMIRAYTNHMRNYDDKFFFFKEITVINPYGEDIEPNRDTNYIENRIDISFFPEGGSLVDNVTSTIAFKAVDAVGKGCDVTVELYASDGELITIFNSTHLGMGFFNIKPVPDLKYYTIAKNSDGLETRTDLPGSFPLGVAIRTFVTNYKKLILTVNTNQETLPLIQGRELTVKLSSRNLINKVTKIKIDSLVNNFLMPVDSIPDGILKITLSANEEFPLCERLVYLNKNDEVQLKVVTDKTEYNQREKVNVAISLTGDSTFTGSGSFSLSAADARFADSITTYPSAITSWFLLESDVNGPVEEPSYYFNPANKNRLADLDLLLMTQGWRDFQWKYDSLSAFKHEIGFILTGKVERAIGNSPIKGANINMVLYGNSLTHAMVTETDEAGLYKFEAIDLIGPGTMVVSATDRRSSSYGRLFIDSLIYKPPEVRANISTVHSQVMRPKNYTEIKQEAIFKLDLKKKYKLSDTINIDEVIITASRPETRQERKVKEIRQVYRAPDKELIVPPEMDSFSGDVFDIIAGRIPSLRVVRSGDDVRIFIHGQKTKDPANPDGYVGALILLDGREIEKDNMAYIFTLPTFIIDRIDVLNASSAYGVRGANGIVNIITRTGMRRYPDKTTFNTTNINVSGFDPPRIFYSPKYDSPNNQSDTPDIRNTIFWEPDIIIEKPGKTTLEYFNADNTTAINIIIEGITDEGIPLSAKTQYKVK